jgi:putative aldouronate transport system substrate-binding protein
MKYLEELGKEIPTNLDDFYEVLKAYTDKTDKPALTTVKNGWMNTVMSGFGMGDAGWYEVDGEYLPRIKNPAVVDYLAFMQKLYKEGLLDNDMPINTSDSAKEKFTNGTTLAYPVMFWDIDGIYDAFKAMDSDAEVQVATFLAKDAGSKPIIYVRQGIAGLSYIPKTAKNPEHAINWLNIISDKDNFKKIYIGEEGKSYEIKDDKYYPIFPAFNDFTNSDKFTGVVQTDVVFEMWQARARKTDAMAEMYDQMNARVGNYDVHNYYESYAASQEAVMDNETSLNTMVNDKLIQAIADGGDPQKAIDNIIVEWDKTGGKEYEAAMRKWHEENKDMLK